MLSAQQRTFAGGRLLPLPLPLPPGLGGSLADKLIPPAPGGEAGNWNPRGSVALPLPLGEVAPPPAPMLRFAADAPRCSERAIGGGGRELAPPGEAGEAGEAGDEEAAELGEFELEALLGKLLESARGAGAGGRAFVGAGAGAGA